MALGIVNCRVRNECDPALALLADFVQDKVLILQICAIFGLGLAYIGSQRIDVINLLLPIIENATNAEILSITSLACGMICITSCNSEVCTAILTKLVDWREQDILKSPHTILAVLGLGFCYLGRKDDIQTTSETLEVFGEPFSTIAKCILNLCAFAGTGDVFMIQELINNCEESIEEESVKPKKEDSKKKKPKYEFDPNMVQAISVLGLGKYVLVYVYSIKRILLQVLLLLQMNWM